MHGGGLGIPRAEWHESCGIRHTHSQAHIQARCRGGNNVNRLWSVSGSLCLLAPHHATEVCHEGATLNRACTRINNTPRCRRMQEVSISDNAPTQHWLTLRIGITSFPHFMA